MRGQAYTLEAVIASVLILSSLVFALQVTAVTPLSASTSNQHIENQQRFTASGALAAADEEGLLKEGVLFYNTTDEAFHNADRLEYYTNTYPETDDGDATPFGGILERSFADRGLAVNVLVHYETDGSRGTQRLVYRGEPSNNAGSATRTVTLFEGDWVRDGDNRRTRQLGAVDSAANETFYAPNHYDSRVYNVVQVEVVVWRM
jgi:hypothetical protein